MAQDMKQPKETLQQHAVPNRPWAKIAADMFELKGQHFLVTVDYYSSYTSNWTYYGRRSPEQSIIRAMKAQLARHGIPNVIVTDNGPQFPSEEWSFKHQTSSPGYPQSNGKAEQLHAVKTAKKL